jgi:hypothetical protein
MSVFLYKVIIYSGTLRHLIHQPEVPCVFMRHHALFVRGTSTSIDYF